ncbi:hypothetical protein [Rhodococcoides fascians]|uniref:hypothetical protein n=1 Tax=Rhodococcoides fascians TaxID=1828 RepID=UPI0012FE397B|nr:hypothetical protein [Rhodococcus fascians]
MSNNANALLFYGKLATYLACAFLVLALFSFIFHIAPDLSWDRNPFNEESRVADDEYWVIFKDTTWLALGVICGVAAVFLRVRARNS